MGLFDLMEPPLTVNGRAVYQKAVGRGIRAGDRGVYFYFGSDTKWHISRYEHEMRAGRGGGGVRSAAAEPTALRPDQVKAGGWAALSDIEIVRRAQNVRRTPNLCVHLVRKGLVRCLKRGEGQVMDGGPTALTAVCVHACCSARRKTNG
jgi:hypothetical protein